MARMPYTALAAVPAACSTPSESRSACPDLMAARHGVQAEPTRSAATVRVPQTLEFPGNGPFRERQHPSARRRQG